MEERRGAGEERGAKEREGEGRGGEKREGKGRGGSGEERDGWSGGGGMDGWREGTMDDYVYNVIRSW